MFLHLSCQSFCSQGRGCVSQHAVGRGCTPPRQRHILVFKKNLPFSQQIRHLTTNMFLLLSICHSRTNVFIHHFLLSRIYPFCPSVIPVLTCVSTGRRRRRMCRGSPRITSLLRLRVIRPTLRTDAPQSKGPFTYTIYSTTAIAKIKRWGMGCIVLSGHIHTIVITMQEMVHAIIHAIAIVQVYRRCDLTIRVHSHLGIAKAKLFFDVSHQSM